MENEPSKFSSREWIFLILLSASSLLQSCVFSLQAPFYPPEAESKGVTPSSYGFVMSFYRLTCFVLCLFYGVYVERIGLRRCFMIGLFLTGLAPTLFGFLDYFQSYSLFLTFSYLIRGLEAFGTVGIRASLCMIIGLVFPGRIAVCIATMECTFLLGISIGPVLGSLLFDLAGFTFMFACFGLFQLIFFLTVYFVLPELPPVENISQTVKEALRSFLSFIRVPTILLFVMSAAVTSSSMDFITAILEPDLKQFNLSPLGTSIVFLLMGPFQILGPGWGYLLDRTSRGEIITLMGSLIVVFSLFVMGPIYFVPLNPSLGLTSAGLLLFGLGHGSLMVSCFSKIVYEAKQNGFTEARGSMTLVSSYYIAAQALGGATGPFIAGLLFDNYGFRVATLFPLICFSLVCIFLLVYIYNHKPGQYLITDVAGPIAVAEIENNKETSPLLN